MKANLDDADNWLLSGLDNPDLPADRRRYFMTLLRLNQLLRKGKEIDAQVHETFERELVKLRQSLNDPATKVAVARETTQHAVRVMKERNANSASEAINVLLEEAAILFNSAYLLQCREQGVGGEAREAASKAAEEATPVELR